MLKSVDPKTLGKDAKTLLQEYLQGRRIPLPVYEVVATHGAAHSQVFEVECSIPKLSVRVSGTGGSRRAAEQAAAKLALESATRLQASAPRRPKAAPAAARGRPSRRSPPRPPRRRRPTSTAAPPRAAQLQSDRVGRPRDARLPSDPDLPS